MCDFAWGTFMVVWAFHALCFAQTVDNTLLQSPKHKNRVLSLSTIVRTDQ